MSTPTTEQLPTTVLFTHYGDNWIRGSERCLLDLIKHLDKKQFKAILWCNQPVMEKEAKSLNIEVYRSDFSILFGWQAPRFNLLAFFKLIKKALELIKKHDIKLIHANSAAPCQWLTFASKKSNIPLICHLHSTYQLRDRLTLGLYQTNMVVGVSKYVVAPLVKDNKPSEQITVIANGIDTERLLTQEVVNLRETLNIHSSDFVIASLGSLIKRKGVDLLIEATAKLLAEIPVHLLVIGDGPETDNLKQQIKRLGLQDNVSLLGECENSMGILRGSADLFVSAAREEAFGLAFAEASLAGLAIVAPEIGGIPNVVIHQQSGLLIPEENINLLVSAINQLYLSPKLCIEMAKVGQLHILNNFTIEKNCQKFQALYKKQLALPRIKTPWNKKLAIIWSLLGTFSTAFINSYQRMTKRGLIHER
jgi:glycosyltransferase involved in cell wall biosynthesis